MTMSVTVQAKKHTCKYLRAWISGSEVTSYSAIMYMAYA